MHVITVLRDYLGISQMELARRAGITQCDLSEIETREPYGTIAKYERLSGVLGVPVDTLVRNDYTAVPAVFFELHDRAEYLEETSRAGRDGEEYVFRAEQERLSKRFYTLQHMVIPYFKLRRTSPGYDILSFDDEGQPIYIEVKTTPHSEDQVFSLTVHEYEMACKLTQNGEQYFIYRHTNWGTPDHRLHIIPFEDMIRGSRIAPSHYICTMTDRGRVISGIAYHRRAKGITQEELARQLGVRQHLLCRWETGKAGCKVTNYRKLSDLLEVPIDDLLAVYSEDELERNSDRGSPEHYY